MTPKQREMILVILRDTVDRFSDQVYRDAVNEGNADAAVLRLNELDSIGEEERVQMIARRDPRGRDSMMATVLLGAVRGVLRRVTD